MGDRIVWARKSNTQDCKVGIGQSYRRSWAESAKRSDIGALSLPRRSGAKAKLLYLGETDLVHTKIGAAQS